MDTDLASELLLERLDLLAEGFLCQLVVVLGPLQLLLQGSEPGRCRLRLTGGLLQLLLQLLL